MYQKGVIVVLVNLLYHVHFKAQGEEGWYTDVRFCSSIDSESIFS